MDYGFVIDNRRCIGCHACTVACKAEHEVPLGKFRTWVKYVERGEFPDVRRYFTVLRCNHCKDAPCVNICPTRALFHRNDGIVDFNNEHCIACKACIAACPYDALYIDPDTETAAKCNYCAHKIESGLEPACVTVCPEQAIVAGDLQDPQSQISRLVSLQQVSLRKPEKRTGPKVYYVDGDRTSLTPGAAPKGASYLWAERAQAEVAADFPGLVNSGFDRTTYDISHEKPWGLLVSLYLWTKSMAAGPILVSALLMLLGYARAPVLFGRVAPMFALVFVSFTLLLLISDLERPERFMKILLSPNWSSWLVWGAWILLAYSVLAVLWLVAGLRLSNSILAAVIWPGLVFSMLASGYTAFLLAQARGRELWRSPLLFPHLIAQAFLAGSALLMLAAVQMDSGRSLVALLARSTLAGLIFHGVLMLAEVGMAHGSREAAGAVTYMIQGPLAGRFWAAAVFGGAGLPICLLAFYLSGPVPGASLPQLAAALSLLGILFYDDCYLRAGQALPLS